MEGLICGRYRITGKIGEGGMAEVYEAVHEVISQQAAVKLLQPRMTVHESVARRFLQEAQAAAAINHPGIVAIYDVGHTDDGRAYIVMERLRGETLKERLGRVGQFSMDDARLLIRQLAGIMDAAHVRKIIHRDLKPDNIFIVPDPEVPGGERVKVLDFGLAKLSEFQSSLVTAQGTVFGTPSYMAPEQCRDAGNVDARADLYSIGCILYACLCGHPPFQGPDALAILSAQLSSAPTPPSQHRPDIPAELDALIMRLLEKSPDARVQSCAELIEILDEGAATAGITLVDDGTAETTLVYGGREADRGEGGDGRQEEITLIELDSAEESVDARAGGAWQAAGSPVMAPQAAGQAAGAMRAAAGPEQAAGAMRAAAGPGQAAGAMQAGGPGQAVGAMQAGGPGQAVGAMQAGGPGQAAGAMQAGMHAAAMQPAPGMHAGMHAAPGIHVAAGSTPSANTGGQRKQRERAGHERQIKLYVGIGAGLVLLGTTLGALWTVLGSKDEQPPAAADAALVVEDIDDVEIIGGEHEFLYTGHLDEARQAMDDRDWSRALEALDRTSGLEPDHPEQTAQARELRDQAQAGKEHEALFRDLQDALAAGDIDDVLARLVAIPAESAYRGDAASAIEAATEALVASARARAQALARARKCDDLAAWLDDVEEGAPQVHAAVSPMRDTCGKRASAQATTKAPSELSPEQIKALLDETRAAFSRGNFVQAHASCSKVLRADRDHSEANLWCALSMCKRKDREQAMQYYRRVKGPDKGRVHQLCYSYGVDLTAP